ncbi:MAG: hypothetical protein JSR72_04405 [Proteobacteria bacterium]|nr:hypothetical protein [Pseudomonadota bacterium]
MVGIAMNIGMKAALAGLFALAAVLPAAAGSDGVAAAAYGSLSLSPPTTSELTVCHGFGCQYRAELGISAADQAALRKLMAAGSGSAAKERQAVAAAGAWFDKRIAQVAGTAGHVARANRDYMYDKRQFDCIDTSRNTTSLLLLLQELGLLRYHTVAAPEARGHIFDFKAPHATAVLVEKETGVKWSIDAWTRAYGQAPEIMTLDRWMESD